MTVYLLHTMSKYKIFFILVAGLIAVWGMTFYDYLIIKYFNYSLPLRKVWKISWISNTFNNFLGFAGLTGAGLRTLLYKREKISTNESIYISLMLTTSVVTGLSFLAWGGIFGLINIRIILKVHRSLWLGIIGFALYLPVYFLLFKVKWLKKRFISEEGDLEEPKILRYKLVLASIIEWGMAGTFLWFIGRNFTSSIGYSEALAVLTAASTAGIISLVPGGIGSFDIVCIWGLQSMGANPHEALAILVMYRLFYYIVPWFIGVILSLMQMRGAILEKLPQKALSNWQKIWINNYNQISDFGVWALSILVFICGLILLLSAAIPGIASRLDIVAKVASFAFMRFSHRVSIIIGLMLLVLSKGIKEHIKRAYSLTMALLITGSIFTFAKGLDYEEALFLLTVAFLLWFTRKRYYRESAPIKRRTILLMLFVTAFSIGAYAVLAGHISIGFLEIYKQRIDIKIFSRREQFINNASYAFITAWLLLMIWFIIRPKRPFDKNISNEQLEKLSDFLKNNGGTYLTHLLFLKDKNLYWAQNDKVLIAYANIRDKLIVLGDPIGEERLFKDAIQEFQRFADRYALYPAFYQVSEKYLTMYHENGYYFFKLGEEAVVDLTTFNLDGKKKKDLRLVRNRLEKENFEFQVIEPPFSKEILKNLKSISDAWLSGRKEKGFSLGWFDEEYLQKSGIAILKNEENTIIAFASLMPKYDNKTMSIDLMRFTKETPNGTMDMLFLKIILWCQDRGYKYFNLGMAPLSNVGEAPFAHRQEKLARVVYRFGNYWYSFSGLRKYKEKFDPIWEPKFLAYPQFMSLPTLLLDTTILISKSKK